ncbi:Ras GTPase [Tieghemostelium lacteum]|uniref:small monomeric GTPase n=1 Tax=Tieghemostelium lacteum TaxID=361077 RepID=A0A151ZE17_TIELA|nr:Ras GTPase [Tieghemostelium lacteum]|eukprot:KYQ92134.1 Ras GTPase [Tieghemostelium lacteum]
MTLQTLRIVGLGCGGVGKSSITINFIQNYFVDEYDPTIEDSYRRTSQVDGVTYLLDILDTAGQDDYSAMRDQYIRTGQGFLLVYDITKRSTYEEITTFVEQIKRVKETQKVPIVLVGNKTDLEKHRVVSYQEGRELSKLYDCPFFESSAKTKINVIESFHELVREIKKAQNESIAKKEEKDKKKSPHMVASLKKKLYTKFICIREEELNEN